MYDPNNVFAQIISGAISAKKIYEDSKMLIIEDINPMAPCHFLAIPKKAYVDFSDFIQRCPEAEVYGYYKSIAKFAQDLGLSDYTLTTNKGRGSGQSVFHFHTHITSGKKITNLD